MGDNFLENQTDKCRKRRDLAMAEMHQPSVLDRPEIVRRLYDVRPYEGESLRTNEVLLAQTTGPQRKVAILRGPQPIGTVEGDGGTVLGDALQETCGITRVRIVNVLPLSGVGKAEVVKGDQQQ